MKSGASLIVSVAILAFVLGMAHAIPPGVVQYQEYFGEPLGSNLNGVRGWTGSAGSEIRIDSEGLKLRIAGGSGLRDASQTVDCSGRNGIIWVHMMARPGNGSGANFWKVSFNDASGNNLAYWQGTGDSCFGGTSSGTTASHTIGTSLYLWSDLCIKIDLNANTSSFYLLNVRIDALEEQSLGTLSHGSAPGNALGRIKIERLSNAAASGHLVYLGEMVVGDRVTDSPPFQHNGEPFLSIRCVNYPGYLEATEHLPELSQAGFNTLADSAVNQAYLDLAQSYGMTALVSISGYSENLLGLQSKVNEVKEHPALLGYETQDEPQFGDRPQSFWDGLTNMRIVCNQLDANHKVWCNFAPYIAAAPSGSINFGNYRQQTTVADVFGMDWYPVRTTYPSNDLNTVPYCVDLLKQISGEGKPVFIWIQCSDVYSVGLTPNLTEIRYQAFSSVIHGATGIFFWRTDAIGPASQTWADVKTTTSQLSSLKDVITRGTTSTAFSISDSGCEGMRKSFNGSNYLVMVNRTSSTKNSVSITLPDWTGPLQVQVLFENRSLNSSDNTFTDSFQPWDTHVYLIQQPSSPSAKLTGEVVLQDFVGDIRLTPVQIEFKQGGNVLRTENLFLDANGSYVINDVPPGVYDIVFSACQWLRQIVIGKVFTAGNTTTCDVSLINGDVDGDNAVTNTDLDPLLTNIDRMGDR